MPFEKKPKAEPVPKLVGKLHYLKRVYPDKVAALDGHIRSIKASIHSLGAMTVDRQINLVAYRSAVRYHNSLTGEAWKGET